jgi:hypothetical protein
VPIHVTIAINKDTIETLHIGRIEGGSDPNDINTYLAALGKQPKSLEEWKENGVEFQHRYGDGALTCVRKALQKLETGVNPRKLARDIREDNSTRYKLKVDLDRAGHHCGYDFEIWKPTAICRCGAIATNPFYVWSES